MIETTKHPAAPPSGEPSIIARLSLLLAILIPALIAAHPLANNDLPMHLAMGDWILQNNKVPASDPFSATGHGESWVAHEWLAAILFKWIDGLGHPNYLIAFAILLSAKLGLLLELIQRSFSIPAFWRLTLLAPLWLAVGRRLMLRPHLLALNAVLLVWWLTRLGRDSPKWLWALIPTMTFWANIHGSFLLGLAFIVGDLCIFSSGHVAPKKNRWAIALGCLVATLLNPHGLALYLFPFQLALDPVFTSGVFEWLPPWSAPGFLQTPAAICGMILVGLSGLGLTMQTFGSWGSGIRSLLQRSGFPLLLIAAMTAVALASLQLRHLALAALLLTPLVGILWSDLHRKISPVVQNLALGFPLMLTLMLFLWGYPAGMDARGQWLWRSLGSGWSSQTPTVPITALVENWEVEGTILCEYEFGGFSVYLSKGQLRPTMDSRNTVYTPEFFLAHEEALQGRSEKTLAPLLKIASAVLLHPAKVDRMSLIQRLDQAAEWARISSGPDALMWVRRTAVPEKYRNSLPSR